MNLRFRLVCEIFYPVYLPIFILQRRRPPSHCTAPRTPCAPTRRSPVGMALAYPNTSSATDTWTARTRVMKDGVVSIQLICGEDELNFIRDVLICETEWFQSRF